MPSGTQEISILFTLLQLKPPAPSIPIISFSNSSNFFFSYSFPCVLSPGLPSTFLFWRVGFLLLSSSCCNGILPLIPILEIEILLSTEGFLPAHLLGLSDVTQNLPIFLLQLDPWKFPIPRTLQLFCLVEHLASAGPSPSTSPPPPASVGVLSCYAGRWGLGYNSSAGLHGSTYIYHIGA